MQSDLSPCRGLPWGRAIRITTDAVRTTALSAESSPAGNAARRSAALEERLRGCAEGDDIGDRDHFAVSDVVALGAAAKAFLQGS